MATKINMGKDDGLFLEARRMLLSSAVTGNMHKMLMFNDISRAHMHARTVRDIHVEVCEEEKTEPGDELRCGKLIKSMGPGPQLETDSWK